MSRRLAMLAGLAVVAAGFAAPAPASAADEGPELTVPAATMAQALHCTGDLESGTTPILFLHGTTSDSKSNWSWNWMRAMDAIERPHCEVDSPAGGTGDIQVSAEYVVNAIRVMHQRSGKKISIVGHSQGGMIGRWALKYWPDTRAMVDDYVGLASSNHGSESANKTCSLPGGCSAAEWQQSADSKFLTALNSGSETWPGISYTVIATEYDEIVSPPLAGFLEPADNVTNVTVQDLCPTETVEHFGMAYDNAAWLLGNDALTHTGPTTLSRVDPATCGNPLMPSVNPATFALYASAAMAETRQNSADAESLPAEPELRSYAR